MQMKIIKSEKTTLTIGDQTQIILHPIQILSGDSDV
jgi:hypothetical protein